MSLHFLISTGKTILHEVLLLPIAHVFQFNNLPYTVSRRKSLYTTSHSLIWRQYVHLSEETEKKTPHLLICTHFYVLSQPSNIPIEKKESFGPTVPPLSYLHAILRFESTASTSYYTKNWFLPTLPIYQ